MYKTAPNVSVPLLVVILGVCLLTAACTDAPTESPHNLRPRSTEYLCVRPGDGGAPADTVPAEPDGTCLPGFEILPWG